MEMAKTNPDQSAKAETGGRRLSVFGALFMAALGFGFAALTDSRKPFGDSRRWLVSTSCSPETLAGSSRPLVLVESTKPSPQSRATGTGLDEKGL